MEYHESEGKTLQDAIETLCGRLKVCEEELNIEVLSDGGRRFLGLGGTRNVKIRATLKDRPVISKAEFAKKVLDEILRFFSNSHSVEIQENTQEQILINLKGDSSGILIGRKGEVLDALQYIVNKIVNRHDETKKRIVIDSEGYRSRRISSLSRLALSSAERVKRFGKPIILNPMNAHDRRIIHITLQKDHALGTKSQGEGIYKKVVIFLKKLD